MAPLPKAWYKVSLALTEFCMCWHTKGKRFTRFFIFMTRLCGRTGITESDIISWSPSDFSHAISSFINCGYGAREPLLHEKTVALKNLPDTLSYLYQRLHRCTCYFVLLWLLNAASVHFPPQLMQGCVLLLLYCFQHKRKCFIYSVFYVPATFSNLETDKMCQHSRRMPWKQNNVWVLSIKCAHTLPYF